MLDPQDVAADHLAVSERERAIDVDIHAAMHQRAVIIIKRRTEQRDLFRRQVPH